MLPDSSSTSAIMLPVGNPESLACSTVSMVRNPTIDPLDPEAVHPAALVLAVVVDRAAAIVGSDVAGAVMAERAQRRHALRNGVEQVVGRGRVEVPGHDRRGVVIDLLGAVAGAAPLSGARALDLQTPVIDELAAEFGLDLPHQPAAAHGPVGQFDGELGRQVDIFGDEPDSAVGDIDDGAGSRKSSKAQMKLGGSSAQASLASAAIGEHRHSRNRQNEGRG